MTEGIARDPGRYGLFQAVRLLRREMRARAAPPPPGELGVRFGAAPHTGFAAAPVAGLDAPEPGRPPRLRVTVMALAGAGGVLPPPYTEALLLALRERRPALRDFLDIFNDRSLALLWRAWARYRPAISAEEPGGDRVAEFLMALTGLLGAGRAGRLAVPDRAVLHLGGHFARRVRPAAGLRAVVASRTGWPVAVEEFQGRWLPLPAAERTHLAPAHAPRHNALGRGAILGRAAWDVESTVGLRIGPVDRAGFRDLMPDSRAVRPLADLAGLHAGPALDLRIRVLCRPEEAPRVLLGRRAADTPRLGWNTWLGSPRGPMLDDLAYTAGALAPRESA